MLTAKVFLSSTVPSSETAMNGASPPVAGYIGSGIVVSFQNCWAATVL